MSYDDDWQTNAGEPVKPQPSNHQDRYGGVPAIRRTQTARYPAFPYLPSQPYAEFGRRWPVDPTNQVYGAVRRVLQDLGLDRPNIGKPSWNPFSDCLQPGQRALIKPNWVMHVNPVGSPEALITHTSVIRVLIDYVLLALDGRGRVDIADAPLQGCDFAAIRRTARIDELLDLYRAEAPGVEFRVLDLRKTTLEGWQLDQDSHQQSQQKGDPRGYSLIDLGRDSLLADIEDRAPRFRVTMYDHRLMHQHHAEARHEYLLANSVLDADLVINVPKLKTHIKAGVTAALKNLIGINGHKEYLPHHTNGCPATGGDQYPQRSYVKPVRSWVDDRYWRLTAQSPPSRHYRSALAVAGRVLRLPSRVLDTDNLMDGGWSGNDTIPRTTLDINNALYFLDTTGNRQGLSSEPLRSALHIVDGVVGGEGYGPLRPSPKQARLVMGGWNPLTIDACAGRLIGLDANKVRLLRYGYAHPKSMLASVSPKITDVGLILDGDRMPLSALRSLRFALAETWLDAAA